MFVSSSPFLHLNFPWHVKPVSVSIPSEMMLGNECLYQSLLYVHSQETATVDTIASRYPPSLLVRVGLWLLGLGMFQKDLATACLPHPGCHSEGADDGRAD